LNVFPRLTAILDEQAAARIGWTVPEVARAFLNGGARLVQIRAKSASSGAFLQMARNVVSIAHAAAARVVVNDRADVAQLAGADGVHVGQEDLPPEAVRRLVGDQAIVGVSTHTPAQLEAALAAPVSYVAIGPVFATATKSTGYDAIGLARVADAARACAARGVPLVAIGGITLDSAAGVIAAGASSVAVIGDLLAGNDPEARVRAFLSRLWV
jgi:thiamine-phosphate pyrophosphorylase